MADLKARLAAAQLGNGEGNKALDAILHIEGKDTTRQNVDLSLATLFPWSDDTNKNQPFRPYSPEKLRSLADDMARHGLLNPIIVRPWKNGYQILSGHNRVEAAKLLGWVTIPAVVLSDLSDADAADIMVSLNFNQRDCILPSERARGWKIKMDSLRHQGTSSQDGTKLRSDEIVANEEGVSRNTIQRYVRLTRLTDELLDIVDGYQYDEKGNWVLLPDNPIVPLNSAESLAHLSPDEQESLVSIIRTAHIKRITKDQALALFHAKFDAVPGLGIKLSIAQMEEILGLRKSKKVSAPKTVKFQIPISAFAESHVSLEQAQKYMADEAFQARLRQLISDYINEQKQHVSEEQVDDDVSN